MQTTLVRGLLTVGLIVVAVQYSAAQVLRGRAVQVPQEWQHRVHPTGKGFPASDSPNANGAAHAADESSVPEIDVTDPSNGVPKKTAGITAGTTVNGMTFHGGPVMLGTTNVYVIWYGNWSGSSAAQSIILHELSYIGGTAYNNINSTYYNGSGYHVSNAVHYNGSTTDNYSQGQYLTDAGVQAAVNRAISLGHLPKDSHGLYFVLTSKDVHETTGFCTSYCGWHTHASISGSDLKYAFVGNAASQCPSACEEQTTRSPNGDPGADGMANVIAHELSEAITDPDLNAWFDSSGQENGDKCAWTFGRISTASNGSMYNVTLGGRQYLLQQNWVLASGGYCALSH